mmetsp:Transcript_15304/g.41928  ORF Transcript_15304/g.41928 Transcript_15304/m.41928 type:complete len:181 (+) Transcript_15304:105-647(+)
MESALRLYRRAIIQRTGQIVSRVSPDPESKEYGGGHLDLDGIRCYFRKAKITPTKKGQFVTLYERSAETNKIEPIKLNSAKSHKVIIFCVEGDHCGQFVFSPEVLEQAGVLSSNRQKGKLSFRVYPPWVKPDNKTADAARRWQVPHFVPASSSPGAIKRKFEACTEKDVTGAKRRRSTAT